MYVVCKVPASISCFPLPNCLSHCLCEGKQQYKPQIKTVEINMTPKNMLICLIITLENYLALSLERVIYSLCEQSGEELLGA